ncbi:MAG: zinc ribbon domain-containing protein [Desulfobacteraceae bacterium]|nr:MAG: zinc ribbon domain-containing protein [Desulfobacteraceae bacterium]
MPIYEYECKKCGHVEEIIQKFSDKPLSRCRICSGKLQKLISQNSFHLKGSGWYVTDYSSRSQNSPTPPKKTGETSDSKKTDISIDKKSE